MSNGAVIRYKQSNYDAVLLQVPKGKRDLLRAEAARRGQSLNAMILQALEEATGIDGLVLRGELPRKKSADDA